MVTYKKNIIDPQIYKKLSTLTEHPHQIHIFTHQGALGPCKAIIYEVSDSTNQGYAILCLAIASGFKGLLAPLISSKPSKDSF